MWKFKRKTLRNIPASITEDEARKRARILVIDDDKTAFPVELMKAEGYNIIWWENVHNLKELETGEYDLIVLDIHGITSSEQSTSGGIGILEHIKQHNPAQLVIAYSSKKYDFNQGAFWKLADDFLGKPSPLIECKQRIDTLLNSRFSISYYWGVLRDLLKKQDVSEKNIQKLEKLVVKKLEKKKQYPKATYQI